MSGKRAKPSRWRFLRFAPLAMITVVVWVMVGLFLLFPDSGDNQAHEWGLDPVPSDSDDTTVAPTPRLSDSAEPTVTAAAPSTASAPPDSATPVADSYSPQPEATRSRTTSARTAAPKPATPRPTSDPTDDAPTQPQSHTQPVSGPGHDNPGKAKGHRKGHGPKDDRP